ncbi:hypothetical protein ADP71_40700 [Vitreoscilla sp. C1]|nr:hypothetical protein [Vitreoscilla sp. C1]QJQ52382.1 hypothetical protein ADP71_40700 [Vitreoscilla sp. C1]
MKQSMGMILIVLALAACSSTGSHSGSSQVYGQISGGVGYTSH